MRGGAVGIRPGRTRYRGGIDQLQGATGGDEVVLIARRRHRLGGEGDRTGRAAGRHGGRVRRGHPATAGDRREADAGRQDVDDAVDAGGEGQVGVRDGHRVGHRPAAGQRRRRGRLADGQRIGGSRQGLVAGAVGAGAAEVAGVLLLPTAQQVGERIDGRTGTGAQRDEVVVDRQRVARAAVDPGEVQPIVGGGERTGGEGRGGDVDLAQLEAAGVKGDVAGRLDHGVGARGRVAEGVADRQLDHLADDRARPDERRSDVAAGGRRQFAARGERQVRAGDRAGIHVTNRDRVGVRAGTGIVDEPVQVGDGAGGQRPDRAAGGLAEIEGERRRRRGRHGGRCHEPVQGGGEAVQRDAAGVGDVHLEEHRVRARIASAVVAVERRKRGDRRHRDLPRGERCQRSRGQRDQQHDRRQPAQAVAQPAPCHRGSCHHAASQPPRPQIRRTTALAYTARIVLPYKEILRKVSPFRCREWGHRWQFLSVPKTRSPRNLDAIATAGLLTN